MIMVLQRGGGGLFLVAAHSPPVVGVRSIGGHGLVEWSFMVTQYNPVGGLATRGLCANGEQLVLPLSAHIGG